MDNIREGETVFADGPYINLGQLLITKVTRNEKGNIEKIEFDNGYLVLNFL